MVPIPVKTVCPPYRLSQKSVSNDTVTMIYEPASDISSATSQPPVKYGSQQGQEVYTQIGRGGHNPQVQGNISAGDGGNINLGLQDEKDSLQENNDCPQENKDSPQENKDIPQDNKDNPQDNKDNKVYTQIGRGGHNPQVQGNISVGDRGNINLGLQDEKDNPLENKDSPEEKKDCPQENKDNPQENKDIPQDNKGNAQIGGGGHNPQVQGNISAGAGGNVNLGLQGKKDSPKDNKDSPQDNKDSPQDNKDKKGNAQIGGGGHNPQVNGNIRVGARGNINLGRQGANAN